MLRPRLIPCLLVKNGGLVKTVRFDTFKYVGDPINAVRIFNEKEVDELLVLDIEATLLRKEPNYAMIRNLAAECTMPLCYGGGVNTVDQFQKLIGLGVEKVAVCSAALTNPRLITDAANKVGRQSVAVVLDVKAHNGVFYVCQKNGSELTDKRPAVFAKEIQELGAGEVVVNNVDRDGTMSGYDLELIREVRSAISIPMTVLGGAGKLEDVARVVDKFGIVGIAAGSLFVFKGVYRAVLINYPHRAAREDLFRRWSQSK